VFAAEGVQVAGVLDWELSTLGDPMADLTYFLMHWVMPPGEPNGVGDDSEALSLPTMEAVLQRYVALCGEMPQAPLSWYLAFNLFRLAAIVQGVAARHLAGNASSARAALAAQRVPRLADAAWRQALLAGA
jgi:aminoglycoside phosphotransferase (APT) family kinase protein